MGLFTGFTGTTAQNLLLDEGALFKNFVVDTDTYATAVAAGKLLGATKGGAEFKAIPEIRKIEIDGAPENTKGLNRITDWIVTMGATIMEVTLANLATALVATTTDTSTSMNYDILSAGMDISESDYENITYVGKIAGEDKPVIIQVLNSFNTEGLSVKTEKKNEAGIPLLFTGCFDDEALTTPPFKIYYPKAA